MNSPKRGAAYEAVRHVYRESPGRSWTRLNGALSGTLMAAIEAHLSILPDDFTAICEDFRGGYWMGDGGGSHLGERFYDAAVRLGHTPACIAFEKWAGRPPALWAEKVKTPERLRGGSEFTWEGLRVTVTSMKSEYLVACTYKLQGHHGHHGQDTLAEGHLDYIDGHYRPVEYLKRTRDGRMLVRFGAKVPHETAKVDRQFKIAYADLASKRKAYDAALKAAIKQIDSVEDAEQLVGLYDKLNALPRNTFRHFDIEAIGAAIKKKRESLKEADVRRVERISEAEALKEWIAGADIYRPFKSVALRVRGQYVETSTGQNVTLESAKKMLPWALAHRRKTTFGPITGQRIDMHEVRRTSPEGLVIGCTLIPWTEIDRLATILKVAA